MSTENILGFLQAPNLDKIANVDTKVVVKEQPVYKPYVYNYGNKRVILPDGTIALPDADWDNHKFQE
jgi:hypothetical protein